MYYDFGWLPVDEGPLAVFNDWYRSQYLMRMIEASAIRGETVGSPPPLVSGAEHVGFLDNSFENGRYIIFEAGIGVTYVDHWNHWGSASYEETIRLLWARIGGIEYGRRPTVTLPTSWGSLKTRQ